MKIRVAVCDDLPGERANMARMVQIYFQSGDYQVESELFSSGAELMASFRPGKFHIVVLDIYMVGLTGIETARLLRRQDNDCSLVFATTSTDHGVESYEFRAADYLLKPIRQKDVDDALDWCLRELSTQLRSIEIRSEWEQFWIPLREILYIEIQAHTALIYTKKSCIQTRRGLDDLETEIDSKDFLRCHRSFLVNMSYIQRMGNGEFLLKNGSQVPIGSSNAAHAKQCFFEWSFLKTWEDR